MPEESGFLFGKVLRRFDLFLFKKRERERAHSLEVVEFIEDILGISAENSAVADQLMAACAGRLIDASGNGEDDSPLFAGKTGGDHAAAVDIDRKSVV